MRTRKRSTGDFSSVANVARLAPGTKVICVSDQSSFQLQQRGFVLVKLNDISSSELVVAAGALQSQLRLCGQLPAQQAPPGYRAFACKQRLEYQDGRAVHPSSTIAHYVSHQVSMQMPATKMP